MFARRNTRRSLITVVCLPILLLCLLIIDKKRDVLLSKLSIETQEIDDENFSQIRIKRSTYVSNPTDIKEDPVQNVVKFNGPNWSPMPQVPVQNSNTNLSPFYPSLYPVIETKTLERFVHLDLKGAAPKLDFFQKLFPHLRQWGATGLLIEYEDMFPFTDRLAVIRHGLAYSKDDVEKLLRLAQISGLKVMPLIQVYGHLEYVLKLEQFAHLREDKRYPQVITPCLEESYRLIFGK